jgi:alpha,alpha-trehalase
MSEARDSPPVYPLRNYALLADGERGALVDPAGNVAWMCAPRWHDPALFSALVGGTGLYTVTPACRFVWGGHYERGSLIWRSRWITDGGTVECREALALPATADRIVLLRRIEMEDGHCRLRVRLEPRAEFDREPLTDHRRDDEGVWHGRAGTSPVHWLGGAEAGVEPDGCLELELELNEGDSHDLVLTIGGPPVELSPEELWKRTESEWEKRSQSLDHTLAPRDAGQAVAVMQGLTAPSGGMVAAATMALPERSHSGTSYDYRFAWIRDTCYAGQAAAAAGVLPLLDSSLRYVRQRLLEHGPDLKPAYTAQGGDVPEESKVGLPGYPGGTDIVGNQVTHQFQLDAFGEIMQLIVSAAGHDRLEADDWRAAELAVEVVSQRWNEPDAGIWELDPNEWTHSRLAVAGGLKKLAACAPCGVGDPDTWLSLADDILGDCSDRFVHESGRWQRAPDDERVDASLLLGALRGAIPPDDPRSRATMAAVLSDLCDEHYIYRFRHDEDAPLGEAEGAFLLCGFWAALACKQQGAEGDALRFFERARSASGSPGLLSEEFDVDQRQLRGNLPQAFVHALLLECAATLAGN